MEDEIRSHFSAAGLAPTAEQWRLFETLHQAVVAGNRRMNLTRITERRGFFLKHVLDSLLPFVAVPELKEPADSLMVADLGSGAGFPGLAVACLRPSWDVVLIERTQKKAAFLEETRDALGLEKVFVVPLDARDAPGRVEALDRGCDLVLARAVGRIAEVNRAAAKLLRPGGAIVHYKGGSPDPRELEEGRRTAGRLGLEQRPPLTYELPPGMGRSVVLCVSRSSGRKRSAARRRKRARPGSPRGRAP